MNGLKNFLTNPAIYIVITLIGISLKFYRLDYKMFWYDEIATVVQVAGADNVLQIDNSKLNEIIPASHYNNLLKHNNFDYPLFPQLKSQLRNMNLNPLHYILLSFWYRLAGDDFTSYRLLSVLIFLLTLPFLFRLAKELFKTNLSGWISVSLYSVSPFIHYFAQEARYYILWVFLLVALHYFLLMALNRNQHHWWIGYICFGALSLYASILSGFIMIEHLLFALFIKKEYRLKFIAALVIIFLLYSPWLNYVFANRQEVLAALAWHKFEVVPWWAPALGLILGLVRTFSFYENYTLFWDDVFHNINTSMKIETFFNIIILAILIISAITMFKREKRESAWFVLLIFIPGLVFFYSLDIARNAITTHWWRYYIFNTIPVILLVTSLFAHKNSGRFLLRQAMYLGFVVISLYSVITISKYRYWYLGGNWQQEFVDNADLLSASKRPLMITDFVWKNNPGEGSMHAMETLVTLTNDSVDVLRVSPDFQNIQSLIPEYRYSNIYVIYASDQLAENLKNQLGETMKSRKVRIGAPVWEISQTSDFFKK